ncbi:hypothetical protein RF11_01977 [Thelohanellus kitauei]|uniref:Uncharacterized protein n=1 Tax=Thelohanellus kitauei TaxID=669202 RepID=A0A0C2ML83_THEKT|nr:hypothetical protein RF11_01977 [Thelohanellus kitauei]
MDVFREDAFLGEIIEVCRLKARLMPIKSFLECKNFLAIVNILQKNDGEMDDLIYDCLSFIKTCIKGFEMSSEGETEKHYRFFSSLARDLRKFVDTGSQQAGEYKYGVNNPEPN